jgi:hypothetical protein
MEMCGKCSENKDDLRWLDQAGREQRGLKTLICAVQKENCIEMGKRRTSGLGKLGVVGWVTERTQGT